MAVINFQIDLGWRLPVCRRIERAEMASAGTVINCDPMDTGDPEASILQTRHVRSSWAGSPFLGIPQSMQTRIRLRPPRLRGLSGRRVRGTLLVA